MTARIAAIHRYPVKGLSPEPLERVELAPGRGLPGDRLYGLARGGVDLDAASPRWLPKRNFLMLMRNARLAALKTRLDPRDGVMEVLRNGHTVARGRLQDAMGRAVLEDFFAAYLGKEAGGRPRLVTADPDHPLTDSETPCLSLINLASVADLQRTTGTPVDPVRFRGNLLLEGLAPWQEFGWIGAEVRIDAVRLAVVARTERCAATAVNPATGERDLNTLRVLERGHGHTDMGVYARVEAGGAVAVGDSLAVPEDDGG